MLHNVILLQRRFPRHSKGILIALTILSVGALVLGGSLLLLA